MRTFPREFSDLLSPAGRRVLDGRDADALGALARPFQPFFAREGLLDGRRALGCLALLERALRPELLEWDVPIPADSISGQQQNYAERLPKTVRVRTAELERRGTRAWRAAEAVGLTDMLRSESFGRFCAALAGRPLRRGWGMQVLCYELGDYSGPHTDHHPEDAAARAGYTDVHLTFCTSGVSQQLLVYAKGRHFSHVQDVSTVGGVTAYRLPFWHYTTPLTARPGFEAEARRWVVLGTFLDAGPRARSAVQPPAPRGP